MSKKLKGSIVSTARRTEPSDAKEIIKFVNQSTLELFGPGSKEVGKVYEIM